MSEPQLDKLIAIIDAIKSLARAERSGAYFVKRGPIDWAIFPWHRYPRGIAIMMADASFAPPDSMHTATFLLSAGAKLAEEKEIPEIDDGLQVELIRDLESVVYGLAPMKDSRGDTLAYRAESLTWNIRGWHDASIHAQGVNAQFTLTF